MLEHSSKNDISLNFTSVLPQLQVTMLTKYHDVYCCFVCKLVPFTLNWYITACWLSHSRWLEGKTVEGTGRSSKKKCSALTTTSLPVSHSVCVTPRTNILYIRPMSLCVCHNTWSQACVRARAAESNLCMHRMHTHHSCKLSANIQLRMGSEVSVLVTDNDKSFCLHHCSSPATQSSAFISFVKSGEITLALPSRRQQ